MPVVVGEVLARHLALIGDLSEEDRARLDALPGDVRAVGRGEDVLRPGDQPRFSVILLDGLLFRNAVLADGARQIHAFYLSGDAPCLETLYLDHADSHLTAAIDSRIGLIAHEHLHELTEHRTLRKLMWRETLVQASVLRQALVRNSSKSAAEAVAHIACELYVRAVAAGLVRDGGFDFAVTQEMLGEAVGLTGVHVNRTLRLLRDAGLLDWRKARMTMLNYDGLAGLADFNPAYLHLK